MIKRLLSWLFAGVIDDIATEIYGAEDRIKARLEQQQEVVYPAMFEKFEDYITARITDALVEQSLRIVGGRPNTRATTPLDEQEGSNDA